MKTNRSQTCVVHIYRLLRLVVGVFIGCIVSCGTSNQAKSRIQEIRQILPNPAEPGALFVEYQTNDDVRWRQSWAYFFDLTGVAWNDARCATLIDSQHVVMAAHYERPSDVALLFHDRNGRRVERYIVARQSLAPEFDVVVARLNLAVPDGVASYALATSVKVGQSVLVTDQTLTAFVHQISSITPQAIQLSHCSDLSPVYAKNLVPGASGHPSFLWQNGRLELIETHTYGGPGAGPNFSSPALQNKILQCKRSLDQPNANH